MRKRCPILKRHKKHKSKSNSICIPPLCLENQILRNQSKCVLPPNRHFKQAFIQWLASQHCSKPAADVSQKPDSWRYRSTMTCVILKLSGKSGGMVIARRVNKNIEILYHIKNVAFVPKRLEMIEIGEDVAKTEFPRLFSQNLQDL